MSEQPPYDSVLPQQPSDSQQSEDNELAFPDLEPGIAWGESITQERADELEAILQEWDAEEETGGRKGPFDTSGLGLSYEQFLEYRLTGADVFWLAVRTLAGTSKPQALLEAKDLFHRTRTDIFADLAMDFSALNLAGADMFRANLSGAFLTKANLTGAELRGVNLTGADLINANLSEASLRWTNLTKALLRGANLTETDFIATTLSDADLTRANFTRADLNSAHLEGVDLSGARLEGADLHGVWLDSKTVFSDVTLDSNTRLGDIQWSGVGAVNLTRINWDMVLRLGDEQDAPINAPAEKHEAAVRAYRQLAAQLRAQGMNEAADRFLYRAQVLQRRVLRRRRRFGAALGSWFLDIISGYGYNPMRSLIAYVVIICAFAGAYLLNAQFAAPHLTWDEALVLSISAFHGRGFFTSGISLGDTLARLAAGEAIIGLLIEITFIATFTQRFFAR